MNLKASFPIRKVWNSITSRGIYIETKIILVLSKCEIILVSDGKFLKNLIALLDFSLLLPLKLSPLIFYALFLQKFFVCSIYESNQDKKFKNLDDFFTPKPIGIPYLGHREIP